MFELRKEKQKGTPGKVLPSTRLHHMKDKATRHYIYGDLNQGPFGLSRTQMVSQVRDHYPLGYVQSWSFSWYWARWKVLTVMGLYTVVKS